jgi:hypothetical protein
MDYNTSRKKIILPEYGRNIHKMVEHIKTVDSQEKRNNLAQAVVNIMSCIHPGFKGPDNNDLKRKMWDHLFIIADFDLEVDSPYPKPTREKFYEKPDPIPYPKQKMTYRHYGKMLEKLVLETANLEDGKDKDMLIEILANHMKKLYLIWNRDSVNNELIFNDLRKLSNGKLTIPENLQLGDFKELTIKKPQKVNKGGSKSKKSGDRRGSSGRRN